MFMMFKHVLLVSQSHIEGNAITHIKPFLSQLSLTATYTLCVYFCSNLCSCCRPADRGLTGTKCSHSEKSGFWGRRGHTGGKWGSTESPWQGETSLTTLITYILCFKHINGHNCFIPLLWRQCRRRVFLPFGICQQTGVGKAQYQFNKATQLIIKLT